MLIAVWISSPPIARCAADSLLVKAFAIPALSMQPEVSRSSITVEMPEVEARTVTITDVKWSNFDGGALPVTISVNIEGVTEGPRLTSSVEETEQLLGGVTDVVGVVPNSGMLGAFRRGRAPDRAVSLFTLFGLVFPNFARGPVLIPVFFIELAIEMQSRPA